MGRRHVLIATLSTAGLLAAACTGGGGGASPSTTPTIDPSASHAPVTLTLWTFFADPEFTAFNTVVQKIHDKYPWLTVNVVKGKEPADILRAINSNTAPDVTMEPIPDDSAKYCQTGAWIDLNPYIKSYHMDMSAISPQGALAYTSYQGKQCSLPVLTDAYGLYYNTDMFAQAGIPGPPKTYSELLEDAKKLTQYNPDGSIKVAGLNMLPTGYEVPNFENGIWSGATWYDSAGKSQLGADPAWAKLFQFQKQAVDTFGFDKLQKWYGSLGGANSEFSPENAFETGKLAMSIDGEWRVSFIEGDKANINYATAPFPVADDHPELYGVGQIGGSIIGLPRNTPHQAEAWLVVQYLATDPAAELELAHSLKNVPTVLSALEDPELTGDPHFSTFLKIFSDPHSAYKPITPLGTGDVNLVAQFAQRYVGGKEPDLEGGLDKLAQQIDQQSAL